LRNAAHELKPAAGAAIKQARLNNRTIDPDQRTLTARRVE